MAPTRGQLAIWAVAGLLATLAVVRLVGGCSGQQEVAVPVTGSGAEAEGRAQAGSGTDIADGPDAAGGTEVATGAGAAAEVVGGPGAAAGGERVYVHVAGRVRRPGLYGLPKGARIAAALERAGGPARGADLAAVNLAAQVEDGQQVLVPRAGAGATSASAAPSAPGEAGAAKLSLASATVEQLDELDGIGPTLAKRIVEYREQHGGFRSIAELDEVEGIGEKRMEALSEAVGP
jgi:competence protein ComEA